MPGRRTVEVRGGSSRGRVIFRWRSTERGRLWVVAAQMAVEGRRHGLAQRGGFGGRGRIAPLLVAMAKSDPEFYTAALGHFGSVARLENALYNRAHKAFYAGTERRGAARFVRSREHYRNDPKLAPHIEEAARIVAAALRDV